MLCQPHFEESTGNSRIEQLAGSPQLRARSVRIAIGHGQQITNHCGRGARLCVFRHFLEFPDQITRFDGARGSLEHFRVVRRFVERKQGPGEIVLG